MLEQQVRRVVTEIVAGVLGATGSALVLRSCGSTGGAEILYVMMHKAFSLTLGTASLLVNATILAVATVVEPAAAPDRTIQGVTGLPRCSSSGGPADTPCVRSRKSR